MGKKSGVSSDDAPGAPCRYNLVPRRAMCEPRCSQNANALVTASGPPRRAVATAGVADGIETAHLRRAVQPPGTSEQTRKQSCGAGATAAAADADEMVVAVVPAPAAAVRGGTAAVSGSSSERRIGAHRDAPDPS